MPGRRRCRRLYAEFPAYPGLVEFTPEELEALKLADIEGLTQVEAADKMGVSQPTFHRILREARRKASMAIVGGTSVAVCGEVIRIFTCENCGYTWKEPFKLSIKDVVCPRCGSSILPVTRRRRRGRRGCWK
ncbi:MAG: hypothetical protein DSY33_01885 [Archaeoglobus sp.]|nr:MAG: hypothetical protein DSY33_01885 [Archaeoglobus sp.]